MIKFVITAVPNRLDIARRIADECSISYSDILIDYEKHGCRFNFERALKSCDDKYSHICVIQDDVQLAHNFIKIVNKCVEMFPNNIFSFHCAGLEKKLSKNIPLYVNLVNYNARGTCLVIPKEYIDGYFSFYNEWLSDNERFKTQFIDTQMRMYACMEGINVMTTVPQIATPISVKSEIAGHTVKKPSPLFDIDINETAFDKCETINVALADFSCTVTHLPKENRLNMLVKETLKRTKMIRRL